MRLLATLFLALLCSANASARDAERVHYDFHSAFLMNLHHFLYDSATVGKRGPRAEWQLVTAPADQLALEQAAAWYKVHYAGSDLLFDADMIAIDVALSTDDARRSAIGLHLAPELIAVLDRAAPAYAHSIWPLHDQSNRRWIGQASALDAVFGAQIESGIARALAHPFPGRPVRVDVVYYSGYWAGAYTRDAVVTPSAQVSYQGLAALEMLYHETAHIKVGDALIGAIDARLKANGRPEDKGGLWHAVHFYTVGEVVRQVLKKRANIDYQTYADKEGVYRRGSFAAFVPLLNDVWRPYLQGKGNFQESVNAMVDRLAEGETPAR